LRKNNILFGIIIGLLAPILGMLVYYFLNFYPTYTLGDFFKVIFSEKTVLSGISTFSLFANVALLTFYLNTRKDETAKGIFLISCVYAIAVIVIKLFT
jgi:hypothetical protein